MASKYLFIRSLGLGAGFAVVACAVIGTWIWYSQRPKPPQPWNKKAITAEYDFVHPGGDKNELGFYYVLQNNTDHDYRISSNTGIEITEKLRDEKSFWQFDGRVTCVYPIFVPAKSRVQAIVVPSGPYPTKEKDNETPDERKQFNSAVKKYVADKFDYLDGFVLFDSLNRYEIDFPSGWEQQAEAGAPQKLDLQPVPKQERKPGSAKHAQQAPAAGTTATQIPVPSEAAAPTQDKTTVRCGPADADRLLFQEDRTIKVVARIPCGEQVEVVGPAGRGTYLIRRSNGQSGYILKDAIGGY